MSKLTEAIQKHGYQEILEKVLITEKQLQTRVAELGCTPTI